MIHRNTKIQWMDVQSEKVFTKTISDMFQMYSHKAEGTSDLSKVLFDSKSNIVKITDMHGWTDVKELVRRNRSPRTPWMVVGAANQKVMLTEDTLVPIYQPTSPFHGFHGETKYPFEAKQLSMIDDSDMLRIRRGVDADGNEVEFAKIIFAGASLMDHEVWYGYDIITKSGFFNGNNIHLFGE